MLRHNQTMLTHIPPFIGIRMAGEFDEDITVSSNVSPAFVSGICRAPPRVFWSTHKLNYIR